MNAAGVDPRDFTPEAFAKLRPTCAECGLSDHVDIVQGQMIYPNRRDLWVNPDGTERFWWLCSPCGAYCGIHSGTLKSLGTPAGEATRRARSAAHAAFDPLWQRRQKLSGLSKHHARGKGYKWLAEQLGIDRKDCHIAMMDAATALRVAEICSAVRSK